jgi:hypothetical protein
LPSDRADFPTPGSRFIRGRIERQWGGSLTS